MDAYARSSTVRMLPVQVCTLCKGEPRVYLATPCRNHGLAVTTRQPLNLASVLGLLGAPPAARRLGLLDWREHGSTR